MRTLATVAALALVACAARTTQMEAPVADVQTAVDCAVNELNAMGYTVVSVNEDRGLIEAEREVDANVTGEVYYAVLNVSTYERGGETQMRVTTKREVSGKGGRQTAYPRGDAEGDGEALVEACRG